MRIPTYYFDERLVREYEEVPFRGSEDFPFLWDGTMDF